MCVPATIPPPSRTFPYIIHEVSKYDVHMMNKTEDTLKDVLNVSASTMKPTAATNVHGLSGGSSGTMTDTVFQTFTH